MEDIGIVNREIGPKWVGPLPVYVSENELPALLARLTAAAEAMGIATKQAELAALLREMIDVFDGYELTAALPLGLRERAEKALVSVK